MQLRRPLTAGTLVTAWGRILSGYRPLLSIEITRDCPLHCPGCYAYGDNHLGGEITLRQVRDLRGEALVEGVLTLVRKHRPLQVSFVGGEPLIRHRELSRILPVLSGWGVYSLVVTSAVIPFPAQWNAIPRVRIAVSIDGLQPEHDARRAPATYDRILCNLQGRKADISWVITHQMMQCPGYLDEYLAFWTTRPEIERVWLSIYTPQKGEQSREMLTGNSRRRLLQELPLLKRKYPALILPAGAVEALARPPADPGHCTFTRLSTNYSADLKTEVKPCFFGGNPDCSQCGCAVSAALHWLHEKPLPMGLKAGHLIDLSLAIGSFGNRGKDMKPGKLIVLTAPLTEMIDHAGYFIQMATASLPVWLEGILNRKYPEWRQVKRFGDGSARIAPAGLRILEKVMQREVGPENVVVCYLDDLDRFIGPDTRVVGISTMNPLGVTFAAGVYTSIFGSSKRPINAHYAELMFRRIQANPYRRSFKVIVGGTGGWQITQTASADRLGVDCVVDGRAESDDTIQLFRKALRGEELPRKVVAAHPSHPSSIVFPDKPTVFGVVEMTTGCGRRCRFCVPDLNPQISLPKEKILEAVRANVRHGNSQISLVTEDMFIWGEVRTEVPFFFPNREALLDLYRQVSRYPGVRQFVLSHCTMAPAVVDPELIRRLSEVLLDKSPIRLPTLSTHPEKRALVPLIGLETGSVQMARKLMPSKAVPFHIEDWCSVVIRGLEILNRYNWFPMLTLMVGNPGETDEDVKATLDLIFEIERRGLFGFLVPSVFTPLEGTRMEYDQGVTRTRDLSPLQWQLIMKCWKMNLRHGLYSWWGPSAFRLGGLLLWLTRLRKTNGPHFSWPMLTFCSAVPERWLYATGRLYPGNPLPIKSRAELLASIRSHQWEFLPKDAGDLPVAPVRERPAIASATAAITAASSSTLPERVNKPSARGDLKVRLGVKETSAPRPICYCFGHTVEGVFEEIRTTGKSTVLEDMKTRPKDGCWCETTHLQGSCCLGVVSARVTAVFSTKKDRSLQGHHPGPWTIRSPKSKTAGFSLWKLRRRRS